MTATTQRQVQAPQALRSYLQLIAGRANGYLEIRYRHQDEMRRLFAGTQRLAAAAETITALSTRTDVYCGAALRSRLAGGRDAIAESHLLWIEIDHPDALQRLDRFPHPATLTVRSGTAGHAHAYWQLDQPVDVIELEHANRRLAHHLGADPSSTDAARILRPAGTLNHKHAPPASVSLAAHRPVRRYRLAQLLDGVPDPTPLPADRSAACGWCAGDRPTGEDAELRAIPTERYVLTLTGRQAGRDHKLACPFHDDRTPSLHCYPDGTFYCYGCRRGGSVYDFAGHLWNVPTKGSGFRCCGSGCGASSCRDPPARRGSVDRAVANLTGEISLKVRQAGQPLASRTDYAWTGGGLVLTISTVLPGRELAVELISVYTAGGADVIATHSISGRDLPTRLASEHQRGRPHHDAPRRRPPRLRV